MNKNGVIKIFIVVGVIFIIGIFIYFVKSEVLSQNKIIDKFNDDDIARITEIYGFNLENDSEILSFEKHENIWLTWYTLKINNIENKEEFINNNSKFSSMEQIEVEKEIDLDQFPENKPSCYYYSDIIAISVLTRTDDDQFILTDYAKNIENLFNELVKKR